MDGPVADSVAQSTMEVPIESCHGGRLRMLRLVAADDARVGAVSQALAPYAWRALTPEMISRRALAALDPHRVSGSERVARQDERIMVLTQFLAACPWWSLSVTGLSRRLVSVLDAWRQESQWLEIQMHWGPEGC